jgi:hypothetical protein
MQLYSQGYILEAIQFNTPCIEDALLTYCLLERDANYNPNTFVRQCGNALEISHLVSINNN